MSSQSLQRLAQRLLLGDLSRSLKIWKHRCARDLYHFDSDEVTCMLIRRPGNSNDFEITAGCYSNDPKLIGVASHSIYWFYRDGPYACKEEAKLALTRSVAKAAKSHPETRFLLSANYSMTSHQIWNQGEWQDTDDSLVFRRCVGCKLPLSDETLLCKNCGELNT